MGLFVYKMFDKGLRCRGYKFKVGLNVCDHATCVKEGFHAAENPLDCLSYYSHFDDSECWLCYADEEVHENGTDTKISCTRLEILRRLSKPVFVAEAVNYILAHPRRALNSRVFACDKKSRVAPVNSNGFAIAVGEEPKAKASANGDIIALLVTSRNGNGYEKIVFLHGDEVKRGVTYKAWRDPDECE